MASATSPIIDPMPEPNPTSSEFFEIRVFPLVTALYAQHCLLTVLLIL
jgi:hypothetical protein